MSELTNQITSNGQIVPVMVFFVLTIIVLTIVIGSFVVTIRRDKTAAQLKQDMLDRGMTAEEIKTVLEAGSK